MLSKEEIEAFMDDADDYEAAASAPPESMSTPWARGMRALTLTTRAQLAMMRSVQKAMTSSGW